MTQDPSPPTVSVVLSTYNDDQFLLPAIESVLGQTLADLELIVVDDGSTDDTAELLDSVDDRRLRVLRNQRNIGLTRSLNRGLEAARGRYIARLDADCLAVPQRLERQVDFLERNLSVGIVGSAAWKIDLSDQVLGVWTKPESDLELRWHSLLATPFIHTSVTMRSSVLARHDLSYGESYRVAQDYDLWVRLLRHMQGANLRVPLVKERVRKAQVARMRSEQLENHFRISERAIREAMPRMRINRGDVRLMHSLFVRRGDVSGLGKGERLHAVRCYLEMLTLLLQGAGEAKGALRVRRKASRRVAPRLIRCMGVRGSGRMLWKLTRLEPTWPILLWLDAVRRLRTVPEEIDPGPN